MTLRKALLAGLGVVILIVGVSVAMPVQTHPQPANAAQSDKYDGDCTGNETAGRCADKPLVFDHSNCQYPDRTTNPPNGCDNSDPCDPANVKGGSGECKDNNENHTPIVTPAPAKAECGGK